MGIGVLVTVGAYIFVLVETIGYTKQIAVLTQTLQDKNTESEMLTSVKHVIADTASVRKELDGYFIAKEGVVDFIQRVEKMGAEAGVTLTFSTIDTPVGGGVPSSLDRLVLRLSSTGSWQQGIHFLTLMESLPYALSVTGARMTKQSSLQWQATLTLMAYKLL